MPQAPEIRLRPGTVGILIACLLVQLLIWRNHAGQAKAIELLKFGPIGCQAGRNQAAVMGLAEDYGILKKAGIAIERPAVERNRLEAIRKASLSRRLSVEAGRFNPLTLFASLFAHVDWIHFIFNAWIFLQVGYRMEAYWGTRLFLGLAVASGMAGQFAFIILGTAGGPEAGHTLAGLSPAIAALAVACLITQGVAVQRRNVALWAGIMGIEAGVFGGYSGGASLTSLFIGGLAGYAMGRLVPGELSPPARLPLNKLRF